MDLASYSEPYFVYTTDPHQTIGARITLLIDIVILKTWYVLTVLYILQLITSIDHRLQLPTRKRYTRPIQWIASRFTTMLQTGGKTRSALQDEVAVDVAGMRARHGAYDSQNVEIFICLVKFERKYLVHES